MRKINACLNSNLAKICLITHQLDRLQGMVQELLPEHLCSHVRVGSMQNSQLFLVCDDASWMMELNYLLPELRDRLREEYQLYQLSGIRAKVATPDGRIHKKRVVSGRLNASVCKKIIQTTNEMAPSPLRDSLRKLAGNYAEQDDGGSL